MTDRSTLLQSLRDYITQYVTFPDPQGYATIASLWAIGTYLWPYFDAFPYLVITSDTKRSGKTRCAELMSFVCANPYNMAGMTAATMYRIIRDEKPTVFVDEAETLSSEAASMMRAVLNVGYRRGQTIPRTGEGGKVEQWPAYCPKAFILIGDVYDTLRDRSIILRMRRAEASRRFLYDAAKAEGNDLGERIQALMDDVRGAIVERYTRHPGLPFLQDRDEEIWTPLFAICEVVAPAEVDTLTRIVADMAAEKTAPARRLTNLQEKASLEKAERDALDDEYATRLLRDLASIINGHAVLPSQKALEMLHDLPTAPWRKFRGDGLTAINMADMLRRFGVHAKYIRPRAKHRGDRPKVARGYHRADVLKAAKQLMQ